MKYKKISNVNGSHRTRNTISYIRFAIDDMDRDSEKMLGIFHAARDLRTSGRLSHEEEATLLDVRDWFGEHLEKPTRFTAAKPPYYRKQDRAISWFKGTALEHLRQIRRVVAIVEMHGIEVRVLKSRRVGYVVYEDEFQIVAEPFSDVKA